MLHIIFSHGKESGPWGGKIRHLASIASSLNCKVDSIDYQGLQEPEQRVVKLVSFLAENGADHAGQTVLAGSSMGACVSLVASQQYPVAGLFLLAPAFGLARGWDLDLQPHTNTTEVVHGWNDELISAQAVVDWCSKYRCTMHCVDDSHRLLEALPAIGHWFKLFLTGIIERAEDS